MGSVLAIVPSEQEHFLVVVDRGKEVSESWHLHFVGHEFFVVEDSEVVSCLTPQQIVFVGCRDEYYRKMQREFLALISCIDLPLLPSNAKPADR